MLIKQKQKNSRIFKIFKNLILMEANLENLIIYKPSLGSHEVTQQKFGPDQFSRFDVYWIQTNKHPDTQAKFLYR